MPSVADYLHPHSPFPIVSNIPAIQEHYEECRKNGTSHRLAEVFAFQRSPAIETDTRFIDGHDGDLGLNPETFYGSRVLAEARSHGINTRRAVYKSTLARYPGDPRAWVESKSDCIRRAEALGMSLEGQVNYTPPERDLPDDSNKPYRVADEIVDAAYQDAIEAEPKLASKKNLKEEIADTLSGGGDGL